MTVDALVSTGAVLVAATAMVDVVSITALVDVVGSAPAEVVEATVEDVVGAALVDVVGSTLTEEVVDAAPSAGVTERPHFVPAAESVVP